MPISHFNRVPIPRSAPAIDSPARPMTKAPDSLLIEDPFDGFGPKKRRRTEESEESGQAAAPAPASQPSRVVTTAPIPSTRKELPAKYQRKM